MFTNSQAKEIGSRYKTISDEEKAKWQARADKAKDVYKKEMEDYETNKPSDSPKVKPDVKKKKKPEPESDSDSDDSDADSDDS
jgi:hypothetical protein